MSLASDKKTRKHAVLALGLITLLLISMGLIVYYYAQTSMAEATLQQTAWQNLYLNYTIGQIQRTTPQVTISLRYIPSAPITTIPNNVVTFLFGYVEATNLTELYYPATLTLTFTVNYSTTGKAKIECSYVPSQTVQLTKGITLVQAPFGIFPLTVKNATQGELITFFITIMATVNWAPVDVVMATQTITETVQVEIE